MYKHVLMHELGVSDSRFSSWQLDCRGRWVKSDAGNSIAGAAGSKVRRQLWLLGPLDQK